VGDAQLLRSLMPQPLDESDARRFDLYRTPLPLRQLVRQLHELNRPRIVVLANMDRIAHLYADDPDASRRYFRAAMGPNVSLIVTFCGPLRRNRGSADVVLLAGDTESVEWPNRLVRVERASIGPFARDATPFHVGEVPGVAELALGTEISTGVTHPPDAYRDVPAPAARNGRADT
jgi:hypothetical protein